MSQTTTQDILLAITALLLFIFAGMLEQYFHEKDQRLMKSHPNTECHEKH